MHYMSDKYEAADEYLVDLLKDNRFEVEESGGSVKTLSRRRYTENNEDDDTDEDTIPLKLLPQEQVPPQKVSTPIQRPSSTPTSRTSTPIPRTSTPISRTSTPSRGITDESSFNEPTQHNSHHESQQSSSSVATTITVNYSAFEETMVNNITKLSAHVEQQTIILHELIRLARKNEESTLTAPEGIQNFPLKTLEEFELFEKSLEQESVSVYMTARLAAVGGSTLESLTRRIMRFLITDQVAQHFNWKGRDKRPFEKTKIMSVIYEAAKRTFSAPEKNDFIIANTIKDWLKHAKTRINSKKNSSK